MSADPKKRDALMRQGPYGLRGASGQEGARPVVAHHEATRSEGNDSGSMEAARRPRPRPATVRRRAPRAVLAARHRTRPDELGVPLEQERDAVLDVVSHLARRGRAHHLRRPIEEHLLRHRRLRRRHRVRRALDTQSGGAPEDSARGVLGACAPSLCRSGARSSRAFGGVVVQRDPRVSDEAREVRPVVMGIARRGSEAR